MKFKFCGNIDCPEWIISEITFLTKISTIKLRIICNNVVNCIITNGKNLNDIVKSLEEMDFNQEEAYVIVCVLEFIIKNSSKFDVEDLILNQELQQLGLPQENADSISRVFKNNKDNLKKILKSKTFSFEKIQKIDYKVSYILANNYANFDLKNYKTDEFSLESSEENIRENYKLGNADAKINLVFNMASDNEFHLTTNKETLGKLINDLEKCSVLIKKHNE